MSYFTKTFDDKIVNLLKNGAVGFMPSDTVYGLSATALNNDAVQRIYNLKGRDNNKPCIILLANVAQAKVIGINPVDLSLVANLWPAALSFITPAGNSPEHLNRGFSTLAVRVPGNDQLRQVILQTGPLVSTSANLQNNPIAHETQKAIEYFDDKLDFYVDAGTLDGQPSTIVQAENGSLMVIRQGVYTLGKS